MWSHGRTSSAVRWRVTYHSMERPCLAMASSQRARSKCSLHSWNTPPRRDTVAVSGAGELGDDRAERPAPCLGREGETRAPHLLDLGGHPDGEGVDTQAGK